MGIVPEKMLAWPLFGVGFENLGINHEPCEVPVPTPAEDQLLVRIDAIGLCFSDVKLVRAGEDHPRVISSDLKSDPVIPGHEAVMTVVKVGDKLKSEYKLGDRFIIQADIYVNGVGYAYGYAINGGMAQYSLIDQRVLNGDEGSYLLPLADKIPAAVAALVEPWTCVIASYGIEHRTDVKENGKMLLFADSAVDLSFTVINSSSPKIIDCVSLSDLSIANLKSSFPSAKINIIEEKPTVGKYDDIVISTKSGELIEELSRLATKNALISLVNVCPNDSTLVDVGNIHYEGWFYQGTSSCDIADAYNKNVRSKLKKDGTCWLLGGAGAMGQMHTQLAVENSDGPRRILVSDMDQVRIDKMLKLLTPKIKERNIEFLAINPKDFASIDDFDKAVGEFAPNGFDDIVMLVPLVPVLEGAVKHCGENALMNIFAGIPAGKHAKLSFKDIVSNNVRYIGSSGSLTEDLRYTLQLVEDDKLSPITALAAIGGMKDLWDGLKGVADGKFPGKSVIFPNMEIPLTAIDDIESIDPNISTTLVEGLYSAKTEEYLKKLNK